MPKKQMIAIAGLLFLVLCMLIYAQQPDTVLQEPASSGTITQDSPPQSADMGAMTDQGTPPGAVMEEISVWWLIGSIAFLVVMLAALMGYMFHLQKKFLKACEDEDQLPIFINAPAGLPPGSIRTILTFLIIVLLLFLVILQAFKVAPGLLKGAFAVFTGPNNWLIISLVVLSLIVGGFLYYMFYLQRKFLQACEDKNQLSSFISAPAGLPTGSIRSILTLMIIIFSLYMFTLQAFNVGSVKFPEALAAILSAIIGFYFGSRTASKGSEDAVDEAQEQLRDAQEQQSQGKAHSLVKDVSSKLKTAQAVMNFLPEDLRKKFGPTLDKAVGYAGTAESLLQNEAFSKAADKAGDAINVFKKDNPIREIVSKAAKSFGAVAGGIPPLAIIGAVVGVSGVLAGVAYNRWRARILNAPFSPSVAPLKLLDPDTAFALILNVPQLKQAFREKLENRDGPFLEKVYQDFIQAETFDMWPEYQQYFDSVETFEEGVQQFRMLAATDQLETEVDPTLFSETGGYRPFMQSIDAIRNDPQASPDLDLLMEVTDNLKKTQTDEPLHKIFDDARKEIENE